MGVFSSKKYDWYKKKSWKLVAFRLFLNSVSERNIFSIDSIYVSFFGLIVNCFLNFVSERNIYVSLNGHLECLVSIGHWGKMNTCLSNIEKKVGKEEENPNRIELFNSIWKNLNWKRWVGKRCQTDCTRTLYFGKLNKRATNAFRLQWVFMHDHTWMPLNDSWFTFFFCQQIS